MLAYIVFLLRPISLLLMKITFVQRMTWSIPFYKKANSH
jgi:hypothetical protein